ncbi:MAG: hypothetical protein LBU32_25400 [Clostridiales bacterium]|nr:hypothetical protein [Clostridiales bacterium]
MKIRSDFVTNSSSVSYLVTFNPEMAEFGKLVKFNNFKDDAKNRRIYDLLSQDLSSTGDLLEKNGNAIYVKQYDFSKKPDSTFDSSFGVPIDEVDFSSLGDDEVWSYIHGEYLVNGRLAAELKGFGSLQVPRDKKALALKHEAVCKRKLVAGDLP